MAKKKLVECKSIGCKVSEESARMLDEVVSKLPKEKAYAPRRISKSVITEEVRAEERVDVATITTNALDVEGEVVIPEGIDLEAYRKTMVVLWNHDQDEPVGRCLWLKPTSEGIKAATKYTDRPTDWDIETPWTPDKVWEFVKSGVVRGKSIGFVPIELRDPTPEEIQLYGDRLHTVIARSIMFEYSTVSTPCNPDSLIESFKALDLSKFSWKKIGEVKAKKPKPINLSQPFSSSVSGVSFDVDQLALKVIQELQTKGQI